MANKNNLIRGLVVQCKKCNVRQAVHTRRMRTWGFEPDEFDLYLKEKWDSIRSRCEDPTNRNYSRYGGRGIGLSEEFHDPRTFISYVRKLPNASRDLQLDRIDNSRGYERGNLRWATARENCNNRDITILVSHEGRKIPLSDFVQEHTDLSYQYVRVLLENGHSTREICSWIKHPKNVEYKGESMSLMEFARRHVHHMAYNTVLKLYRRGKKLEEIMSWNKCTPKTVEYKGMTTTFPEFVRGHTSLSYPYANHLRRKGIPLEEIASIKGEGRRK